MYTYHDTRLAQHGLVHCDFNEFNLMVDQTGQVRGGGRRADEACMRRYGNTHI